MKNLIKFGAIFMILTSSTIFNGNSLLDQNYTMQIAMLSNSQYPTDALLSKKDINFIAPDYPEDMYLYCFYPFQNANHRDNKSQRFEISKNNHFKITLLQHETQPYARCPLFLVPRESVQKYISELKNIFPLTDDLQNPDAIYYPSSEDENKKINAAREILKNELMFAASIDLNKISDGDTIHLPKYKPNIPTPKILPSHPSTPESTNKTFHLTEGTGRVLTLRIPEQEIKLGVNFSN